VVARLLYDVHPDWPEGDLTRARAALERGAALARCARELGLGDHLHMGPGELKSGGYLRESILADVFEALIGAVFIDGGFAAARQVIVEIFQPRIETLPDADALKDPKTRLQELLQARGHDLPTYEVVSEQGADHAKRFRVACRVDALAEPVCAEAGSRRKAEQRAAREMHRVLLEHLDGSGHDPGG